ncbi:MAG: 4-hydroxy-tetrahydrodipicolinate reductase, partial [Bacteroidota bacterium]|nr:4-hydroxy-tetrahydrodipicolinate reductase [Bacteroidota bacterium]
EINKKLASMMAQHKDYNVSIEETHHTQKLDAPSGTAITIAEQIMTAIKRKKNWVNNTSDNPQELEIISKRIDPAAGIHRVKYSSAIDDIEIVHTAHNRKGFALGAIMAAEFIKDKKGVFEMKDVLKF